MTVGIVAACLPTFGVLISKLRFKRSSAGSPTYQRSGGSDWNRWKSRSGHRSAGSKIPDDYSLTRWPARQRDDSPSSQEQGLTPSHSAGCFASIKAGPPDDPEQYQDAAKVWEQYPTGIVIQHDIQQSEKRDSKHQNLGVALST